MTWLTHKTFIDRVEKSNSNYWKEGKVYRWEYMSYVIEQARTLGGNKIIEAGASGMPLNDESFLFDLPFYDLNKPFPDILTPVDAYHNRYDIFIALQVWEHLDNQASAFQEVMRISKSAILSFPYKWKHGDSRHRNIDDEKISAWTCGVEPISIKHIKNRVVYVWRFTE